MHNKTRIVDTAGLFVIQCCHVVIEYKEMNLSVTAGTSVVRLWAP